MGRTVAGSLVGGLAVVVVVLVVVVVAIIPVAVVFGHFEYYSWSNRHPV